QVVPVRFWFQPRPHRNQPDKQQSNDLGLLADPLAQRRNDSYTTATAPTNYSLGHLQPNPRWPIPSPPATHRPLTSFVCSRHITRCWRRRRLQPQRHHRSHLPSAKRSYPWLYTITCPTRVPRLKVMRILHTSDWHLGRSFHNTNMLDAQQHAIDSIVSTITEHDIDLVLLARHVYDRALPPVDAVSMFDQALVDMRAAGAQVVVTSGNHDSAIRLGFMSRMMRNAGVHIRTMPETITEPIIFDDDAGKVCIWAVP